MSTSWRSARAARSGHSTCQMARHVANLAARRDSLRAASERRLVGANRFELSTSSVSGRRSNQLSYAPISNAFRPKPNEKYSRVATKAARCALVSPTECVLVDGFLQRLAGGEANGLAFGDADRAASQGIASLAGLADRGLEACRSRRRSPPRLSSAPSSRLARNTVTMREAWVFVAPVSLTIRAIRSCLFIRRRPSRPAIQWPCPASRPWLAAAGRTRRPAARPARRESGPFRGSPRCAGVR